MQSVLGLIVNPIAGMGGSVALHGTDGSALDRARELGATPVADLRAKRALKRIVAVHPEITVVTAPSTMGEDQAREVGFRAEAVAIGLGDPTTAKDTIAAAQAIRDRGITLLLFVGGDGTARDIVAASIGDIPLLGVPAGVKMHSGVFGTTPEAAGDIAARFLRDPTDAPLRSAEVLDVVENSRLDARLFGEVLVPYVADKTQRAKSSPARYDEGAIQALCEEIAESMDPERLYIIGPGTTTARILEALGTDSTLNGVDLVRRGAVVIADASERELLDALSPGQPASIILGVIGGQGFLLGRGNQQISAAVIKAVGAGNVEIVASAEKIEALDPPTLHVDFGVDDSPSPLVGYQRVRTGPRTTTMLRVMS